jgi:hypothetical protein
MAIVPIQIGDVSIKERPGSPKFQYRNGIASVIRVYGGTYAALLQWVDAISPGATFVDLPFWFGVDDIDLVAVRGTLGMGIVTFTLTDWQYVTTTIPIVEIEWTDLSKDIITNPIFAEGGASALTTGDLAGLTMWKNETDWTAKSAFKYHNPPGASNPTTALLANATVAASKIIIGQDSFNTSYPIVKSTEYYRLRPSVLPGWVRENPPSNFDAPSGYEYIRGQQRRTFDRRYWILNRSWIGAFSWDHTIYHHA